MISIDSCSNPLVELNERVVAFSASDKLSDAFALTYNFRQSYLPGQPEIQLLAVVALNKPEAGLPISAAIAAARPELLETLAKQSASEDALAAWAREWDLAWLELGGPLALAPVHIPKPWGQEIWYTGIEARGQSRVADRQGNTVPLPWLLSLFGERLLGKGLAELILLKVLDPLPEPVFGDLYFEMHEEKREVYIVTRVDQGAWPDNRGGIRFGFNQQKRADCGSDAAFKRDYLEAVSAYRAVRQEIDALVDQQRHAEGIDLNAPVDAETLRRWLLDVPPDLRKQEEEGRAHMESFIQVAPLQVGDVVKVPCFTPHSLLHGVRTVEFQTPVYERKILSFAQKVLTQQHWDTEAAMDQVSLDAPQTAKLPVLSENSAATLEEVAVFEDFCVQRLTLRAGQLWSLAEQPHYLLVMGVAGNALVNTQTLAAEQAMLLPAGTSGRILAEPERESVLLLAMPIR